MRPTWTSPGRVVGPAWPCTGRGLPGRRVTATPVRSYRTISPLPVRGSRVAASSAVSFLWHFPAGFPGWALPTALPCGVRTFLEALGEVALCEFQSLVANAAGLPQDQIDASLLPDAA